MTESPSFREAFRYCRWLTRQAGSHFSLSFALLAPQRRAGMEVLYAYCRAVDDVVDQGNLTESEARAQLALWRRELAACERGFPTHPIAVALRSVRERFDLPLEYFEKILVGVEMDLRPRRYETFDELKIYCEHVASAVGLISVRIFGCRHPAADQYANALGIAFQLTNILRDLKSDLERGRLYLPLEDLRRFGVAETELLNFSVRAEPVEAKRQSSFDKLRMTGELSDKFQQLLAFERDRALDFFRQAEEHCRESGEARNLLPARIMSAIYRDVLRSGGRISKGRQVGLALRCLLTSSS